MSYKPGSGSGAGGDSTDYFKRDTDVVGREGSVAFWFRKDGNAGASAFPGIYTCGEADFSPHFSIQLTDTGRIRLTQFNSNIISTLGVGTAASWHRILYVCDTGVGTQTQWVYCDGVQFATLTGNTEFTSAFDYWGIGTPNTVNGAYRMLIGDTDVQALVDYDDQWSSLDEAISGLGNFYECPLDADLNDDSGGSNDLSAVGTVTQIADLPDLTFPRVMASANTNGTTLSSSLNMPAGIVAGELLIAIAVNDGTGGTNMAISGWTQLFHTQFTSNVISHGAWAKIAAGSDTATLTGAAQDFAAVVLRIENHGVSNIASDVKVGTAATGTSATPNPPSLDAGASRKHLWIASNGSDDDDEAVSFPLEPSGFTGVCQIESAQSTSSCMLQVAQLAEETQTKDPGTFNLGASEEWIAQTIAVPPAVSAAIPPFRSRMHSALLARRQRFGRDRETGLFLPTGLLGRRAA